jgi:hypothetical protein
MKNAKHNRKTCFCDYFRRRLESPNTGITVHCLDLNINKRGYCQAMLALTALAQ